MSELQPDTPMPAVGDDGEVPTGLSLDLEDSDKQKKRRPSRRRRFLRQFVLFLAFSIPIDSLVIAIILMAVGVIDVTSWPLYRRLCVASLSQPRLAYTQYVQSTLTTAVMSPDGNRAWGQRGQVNTNVMVMPSGLPTQGIYLTDDSATRTCPLSIPGGEVSRFVWSPDGKQIAFAAGKKGDAGTTALYVLDTTDMTQRLLIEVRQAQPLLWAPDGKKLLYFLVNPPNLEIYEVGMDGTTDHLGQEAISNTIQISPDAARVADTTGSGLAVANLDGTDFHYLTTQYTQFFAWSPDGKSLAYSTYGELDGIDADGTHSHLIAPMTASNITWTRDGRGLAFVGIPVSGSTPPQLYTVNSNGSNLRVIGRDVMQPAEMSLSPDSAWLATTIRNSSGMMQIAQLKTDGGELRSGIGQPGLYTQVDWQPDPSQASVDLGLPSGLSGNPAATAISLAATPPPTLPAMQAGSASLSGNQSNRGQLTATPTVIKHAVWNVTFAPDGKSLVSVTDDGVARLWDAHSGGFLQLLNYVGSVRTVAVSPDGKTLATLPYQGNQGQIDLWDVKTATRLHRLDPNAGTPANGTTYSGSMLAVAFSPDGNTIVSGGADKIVRQWDVNTGRLIGVFSGQSGEISCVAVSPDGKTIASSSKAGDIWLWTSTFGDRPRYVLNQGHMVNSLSFSPAGNLLAVTSTDGTQLWDSNTGQLVQSLRSAGLYDTFAIFNPDGNSLAMITQDRQVLLWDVKTSKPLPFTPTEDVTAIAYSPDGNNLAMGDSAGNLRILRISTPSPKPKHIPQ